LETSRDLSSLDENRAEFDRTITVLRRQSTRFEVEHDQGIRTIGCLGARFMSLRTH
jgi:hypothetical protein